VAEPTLGDEAVTRSADRAFVLLCAAMFLGACGIGVLFPLLARIQSIHHLPTYALGLMSGAYFFAALVAQLGSGRLLDGRRGRSVLLAGILMVAGGLAWFAHGANLAQLVAARALEGLGGGIVVPASLREAAVGVTGDRRGRRLGLLSSAMMAGITVGPLIGSLLAAIGGVALPFETIAALLGVVFVAFLFNPKVEAPVTASVHATAPAPRPRLRKGPVVAVLLLGVASQLPSGLYDALWSRLLTDRGASSLFIGFSLSLFGLPFVLLAPFGGRLAERRGPLLAATVALLISDVFMASYGFVPSPVIIAVLGVAEACAQAVAVPGGYAAVARAFPEERAATGQGWFSAAGTAAAGLAAVLGAPVYGAFGSGAVFAGGAVISALVALGGLGIGSVSGLDGPAPP
jgi:MFS family permease